jgi:broad specificity phosphatase PhoE
MSNITTVTLIRHGISKANEFKKANGGVYAPIQYTDSTLGHTGIRHILNNRSYIRSIIGKPDYIFVSPLKRPRQTFLLMFDDVQLDPEINVKIVPLITERGTIYENHGFSRSDPRFTKDPDSIDGVNVPEPKCNFDQYKHNDRIPITNDLDNLFFYDAGWKKEGVTRWNNDNSILSLANDNFKLIFDEFIAFLNNPRFHNTNVVCFTHYVFIKGVYDIIANMLGKPPLNHDRLDNLNLFTFQIVRNDKNISFQITRPINHKTVPVKPIKLLTYNISWEANIGVTSGSVKTKCPYKGDKTICGHNIIRFIEHQQSINDFDFICLQETADKSIHDISTILPPSMTNDNSKSGTATNCTFYNSELILENMLTIKDIDASGINVNEHWEIGRPILVNFFSQGICLINVHAPHDRKIYNLNNILTQLIDVHPHKAEILSKFASYHVFLVGDFNDDFDTTITIFGREFISKPNRKGTCCNNLLIPRHYDEMIDKKFDNIVNAKSDHIESIELHYPDVPLPASDHLPLIGHVMMTSSRKIKGGNDNNEYMKYMKYKKKYVMLKNSL